MLCRLIAAGFEVRGCRPSREKQSGFARAVGDQQQQPTDDVGDTRHAFRGERRVRRCRDGFLDLACPELVFHRAADVDPRLLPFPPDGCRRLRQAESGQKSRRLIVARHGIPSAPGTLEMP